MRPAELFQFRSPRIKVLHLTWIAFFISFFTWFNMAPLATTMVKTSGWLTADHMKALAILNVALTIPARVIIGMLLDKYGPRIVFSTLLISMSIPTFVFAFGDTWTQLAVSRLFLSTIGASFVIGIRMVSEWFPPKSVGFAEGFYAGWGNFGSAAAAIILPWMAFNLFGGDDGWRYAIAATGAISFIYGIIYYFAVTDTPKGKVYHKPKKISAMEVSTWGDLIQLILWTFPLVGALGLLSWRLNNLGFISSNALNIIYALLLLLFIYQVGQIIKVNVPILRKGVPEDDKYRFKNVAVLNATYFANFGAELAVVSMLPAFFQTTYSLTPTTAGLIAASFAFVNLFARPFGGWLSDRMKNRRLVMLMYMIGIGIGFVMMGFLNSTWPVILAVGITIATSLFVQGAEGATFAMIPLIKKRITGQVAGMAGAYGNVGAVVYLTLFTMVSVQQFFFILATGAFISFLVALLFLEEPEGAFADDYNVSSVDREKAS
ncbi:NarK family nitrate/nitrite MFS transporter [Microaerobacter geothermalis]|uniref:NarK family nitrate/nitrite MFS transporter n=1 Tax=Microaerobacter geothermalis TaxID=674972 RepID=UPI001F3300EF|nr:NarK family nitrate/nitrite MFS transporter [Microaerobacter geothermalis]MCF6092568.1 NarK family nitrate/nitrite MFS transporter [Microaerobacter geothermalis]